MNLEIKWKKIKELDLFWVFSLHLIICFVGLVGLLKKISIVIGFYDNSIIYNTFIFSFYYPGKKVEILFYLIVAITLFFYSAICYWLLIIKKITTKHQFSDKLKQTFWQFIFLGTSLFLNIFSIISDISFSINIGLWLFVLFFPFNVTQVFSNLNKIFGSILLLAIMQIGIIFYPFVFENLYMINEYFDIPESTIVSSTNDIKYTNINRILNLHNDNKNNISINNIEYMNFRKLSNPYIDRYNLEKENASLINDSGFTFRSDYYLKEFLSTRNSQGRFFYDNKSNKLYSSDGLQHQEWLYLRQYVQNEDKQLVDNLYTYSEYLKENFQKRKFTKEELDFLEKNKFEFHWQVLNRWVIHHHNFLLAPINEYALGKNINEIFMQYGWLNVVLMKNLLEYYGGINYHNYFKLWYSFFYIYYALYIGLLFLLFRRIDYVLITVLISFSFLNSINFQFLFLGPGISPIRHFFDVFVIGFFFLYLKSQKIIYLIIAILFALVGVLNNSQMGFFCLISLVGSLLIVIILEKTNRNWMEMVLILLTVIGGLYLFEYRIGTDLMSKYFLDGLLGAPISSKYLYGTFALLAIGYITIMIALNVSIHASRPITYITLFMLFYSQTMFTYYIWGSSLPHFKNFGAVYALTGVLCINLAIDNIKMLQLNKFKIINVIVLICVCLYLPTISQYFKAKQEYQNVFTTHITYEWNLDKAKFISTMNPKYFEQSIDLIQKYSNKNSIYILSKYDNFLPFLSGKYSAMPFFDVPMFLITNKEIQQCIDKVNIDKPQYLFIDTDINRPLEADIVSKYSYFGYLHDESVSRVQRLNLLKEIYRKIKDEYEPLETGYLITVYKRIY